MAIFVATTTCLTLGAPAARADDSPALRSFRDTVLQPSIALLALDSHNFWGGEYTTPTGETVEIFFSRTYPVDEALAQRWATVFGGLLHGPELSRLTAYIAPLREVQRTCGREALACYSPIEEVLFTPGENTSASLSAESVLAHEYGHHVARNRRNDPWEAVDWGTKRWASYMNICARARRGEVAPGNEQRAYERNPGEGFAEAYRVVQERRWARAESPWRVVDTIFRPDATAVQLLEQDVVDPWSGNSTSTLRGTFRQGSGRTRSFSIATPYDGTLELVLDRPASTNFRLALYRSDGRTRVSSGQRTIRTTVCGQRSLVARVERQRGFGAFTLEISKP